MFVYWTMFAVPAFFALLTGPQRGGRNALNAAGLFIVFVGFVVLIGLRYEVGADWSNYEEIVAYIGIEDFSRSLSYGDPGFNTVAWLATRIGAEVYGPNLVCGLILVVGLFKFCREQDNPWLTIAAAVPYLVIVVGMGYVRQAAAIGLILIALIRFERGQFGRTIAWVLAAAMFHATSLLILSVIGLAMARKRIALLVPVGVLGVGLSVFLLQSRLDTFTTNYIEAEYDSSGALVRLLMNAVPACIFIASRKSFPGSESSRVLWLTISLASLLLVAIVFVSPSTTIIDRIGLYLIPIQLYVFGNLSRAWKLEGDGRIFVSAATLAYYAAILFVWLNYATHSTAWVPYRFFPWENT